MILDAATRRNLELTETIVGGRREGSLLSVLDLTGTRMGGRLLRDWLLLPAAGRGRDPTARRRRRGAARPEPDATSRARDWLRQVYDLERLLQPGGARPRQRPRTWWP